MTNTEETEQSKDKQSIWDEAINLCRMRIALKTSAERIRDNVDRRVRWDCAEAVWVWLTTTLQGGGGSGETENEKTRKNAKKKCGKMRRKKAMTRTELPVALHVVFQQHTFPVTRILVPGPKPQTSQHDSSLRAPV